MHIAGYALVAGAIYFGLRSRAPSDVPAPTIATTTSSTAVSNAHEVLAPGSMSVVRPAEPTLSGVPSVIPPPGSEASRARATERAQAALDLQRPELAKACFKQGAPAVAFTVRLLFDKTGKEVRRSLRTEEGTADAALLSCLGDSPRPLEIGPVGEQTTALVKLRLP